MSTASPVASTDSIFEGILAHGRAVWIGPRHELRDWRLGATGLAEDVHSGIYSTPEELTEAAWALEGKGRQIYITGNPTEQPSRRRARGVGLRDDQISRRSWLYLDIDGKDREGNRDFVEAAGIADEIIEHLAGKGIPRPLVVDSGQGLWATYRIDLPNEYENRDGRLVPTPETRSADKLVVNVLRSLHTRWSAVDLSVSNASRVIRLAGTVNQKSDSRAGVVLVPDEFVIVSVGQLEMIAADLPQPSRGEMSARDVRAPIVSDEDLTRILEALEARGISLMKEKPGREAETLLVLTDCPRYPDETHGEGAMLMRYADGGLSFKCQGGRCVEDPIGLRGVLEILGLGEILDDLAWIDARLDKPVAEGTARARYDALFHFDEEEDGRWGAVDLGALLAGEVASDNPRIFQRDDGEGLLYLGRVNLVFGEPVGGKSWLGFAACAQAVASGRHAVYLDYEDDALGAIDRLQTLGISDAQIGELFHYYDAGRFGALDDEAALWDHLIAWRPAVIVVDAFLGLALAQGVEGDNSRVDIEIVAQQTIRPLARCGAAVLVLDHVAKSKENRTWAIGSERKKGIVTGIEYRLDLVQSFGRGLIGRAKLQVTKDRRGLIQPRADDKLVAILEINTQDEENPTWSLLAPSSTKVRRPTELMRRVSDHMLRIAPEALSMTKIESAVSGKKTYIRQAVARLSAEGYLEALEEQIRGQQATVYRHRMPFDEVF